MTIDRIELPVSAFARSNAICSGALVPLLVKGQIMVDGDIEAVYLRPL